MESNPETMTDTGAVETLPPFSIGKALSEARVQQGLSIADVANSIKFSPRQIEALEADDFSHLPELAFVRGFVRSYAKLLHIDEHTLLDTLPVADQQLSSFREDLADIPTPTSQNRRANFVWLAAALGLIVLLGAGFLLLKDKPVTKKSVENQVVIPAPPESLASSVMAVSAVVPSFAAVSAVPVAAAQAAKVQANKEVSMSNSVGQGAIHLVFEEESWVDVKDKFGKTLLKQVNPAHSEQWINGRAPFSLVIGNASGVRLYYESEEVDLKEYTDVEVARLMLE